MDINKYLTNKDLQLSNDDINIEKLERDIRKGYVLSEEVDKARDESIKESTSKYAELETKYNTLEKTYNDLQAKNVEQNNVIGSLKLQVEMTNAGFKQDKFEEVAQLRNTLFKDETDDTKAIGLIKEKFGATYFPQTETKVEVPNESNFTTQNNEPREIKITRKTSIRDLMKK